jgi:predicted nucleic acid-binding protein
VQPLRLKHLDLVDRYRQVLLASKSFQTVAVSAEIAERAAQLRAQQRLRTPDAIQIATAISAGAAAFLTNDARLVRTSAIEVLVMSELCGD